jgi:beta-N-acetylhexosaminidase
MAMASHLLYAEVDSANPASLSSAAIKLLREELGFDGVIITDDLAVEGAKRGGAPAKAAFQTVGAGADLLIVSNLPEEQAAAYDAVVAASSPERCRAS